MGPGRPLKYVAVLEALEDDVVYSPATIATQGFEKGILNAETKEERESLRRKVRHTLSRFRKNHQFPIPDGTVEVHGQQPSQGWLGRRWKDAIPQKQRTT